MNDHPDPAPAVTCVDCGGDHPSGHPWHTPPAPAVVPDVEVALITVPIESAGYPAHYRHGWRDAMAAIRAEGRGALDVAVLAEAAMLAFHERKWSVQEYAGAEPAWTWQSVAAAILGEYDRLAQREPAESQGPDGQ